MIGGYYIEWEHRDGTRGIRPSKADKNSPDHFKRRSDALDYVAHLNVRATAYTYKVIPAISAKLVGPYKKEKVPHV